MRYRLRDLPAREVKTTLPTGNGGIGIRIFAYEDGSASLIPIGNVTESVQEFFIRHGMPLQKMENPRTGKKTYGARINGTYSAYDIVRKALGDK